MSEPLEISPVSGPLTGTVRPPGSKSLTNRALIVAALADGTSTLTGALDSRDTQVMIDSLIRLGMSVDVADLGTKLTIEGCGGRPSAESAELWLENSGTSIRFLTALCTLGKGSFRLDGNERMRERPIGDLVRALNALGADVTCEHQADCPPVMVTANGLPGGTTQVAGNISSQYLSALLMSAPCAQSPVRIEIEGELVSRPYVDMTLAVMREFGVDVTEAQPGVFEIPQTSYRSREYDIEPDASAASYFFAAAAITGGTVTVEGLSRNALQGDVEFVDCLAQMGCDVQSDERSITVTGGELRGIDVDMNAISDTAQTLAVVAPFATGPTRIRNVAHMRHKETDRVHAVVTELRKLGLDVEEFDDGMTIHPGPMQPASIATYDDHRMAMSFALIALKQPGVRIEDPECTSKTYPHFFEDLRVLCEGRP
ncbi:MAG: 3-phosphoshikimate 1-carboxyvinyltransferase [Planctomycetaceae bacterium]|nr:3-phosphoshikimate 1-carboxyvinyltransferase [Planctomycetaceae bacterium]